MTPCVPPRAQAALAALATVAVIVLGACSGSDATSPGPAASVVPTSADGTDTAASSPTTTIGAVTTESVVTSTSSTTSTTSTTTTTTIPIVTAGGIVKVANASNFGGAAGLLTASLVDLGFTVREATNAAGWEEILDVTKIYSREEARPAAESISRLLGGVAVERMPTPVPIQNAMEGLGDANIVVMLGMDLAGKPLPSLGG